VASGHPDLAGVVLDQPLESPTAAIFNDPRARLVPAHVLVSDRWDTEAAASNLLIPSLWIYRTSADTSKNPIPYSKVSARKMIVWLSGSSDESQQFQAALTGWLDQLSPAAH
jgi:hypothetical protein